MARLTDQGRPGHRTGQVRPRVGHALSIVVTALMVVSCTSSVTPSDGTPSAEAPAPVASASPSPVQTGLVPTVVSLDGTVERAITDLPDDAWNVAASPDGKRIAYVTRSTTERGCGACRDHGTRAVVVDINGTRAHYLTLGHFPVSDIGMPAWSPDGSEIALVATKHGNQDIYVVPADGRVSHPGSVRQLTFGPAQDEFPTWSPDGTTVAFDSSGATAFDDSGLSETQEIWSIPARGGAARRLTSNDVPDQAPTYSPDGSQIAFFHDGEISMIDADGGRVRSVLDHGVVSGWSPEWSTEGDKIAYLVFTGQRATIEQPIVGEVLSLPLGRVKVVDLEDGEVHRLSAWTASSFNPVSWMPSGEALLVDRYIPS
jgi:Tol biopolymer transport system component